MLIYLTPKPRPAAGTSCDGLGFVRTTTTTVQPSGKDQTDVHIRPPAALRKPL